MLKRTPSSFLGSCRYKLPDIRGNEKTYDKIFGKINEAYPLAVLALCKRGCRGEPAGVSAHYFDYRNHGIVVNKTVAYDFLGGCGYLFST